MTVAGFGVGCKCRLHGFPWLFHGSEVVQGGSAAVPPVRLSHLDVVIAETLKSTDDVRRHFSIFSAECGNHVLHDCQGSSTGVSKETSPRYSNQLQASSQLDGLGSRKIRFVQAQRTFSSPRTQPCRCSLEEDSVVAMSNYFLMPFGLSRVKLRRIGSFSKSPRTSEVEAMNPSSMCRIHWLQLSWAGSAGPSPSRDQQRIAQSSIPGLQPSSPFMLLVLVFLLCHRFDLATKFLNSVTYSNFFW